MLLSVAIVSHRRLASAGMCSENGHSGPRKRGTLYDGAYTHPVRSYKGNGAVICRPQLDIKI